MHIKKYVYLILIILVAACEEKNEAQILGSPTIVSQTRNLDAFERIHISSVIDATIVKGDQLVALEANENIIDLIVTEVIDHELYVGLQDGNYDNISITISLSLPTLLDLTTTGVNNVVVSEFHQTNPLEINIEGVGNIEMIGSSPSILINSSGSSNLEAFDFIANQCEVNLTGVGNVQITVLEEMVGALSGVGNILYKGSPDIDVEVTGVGNIVDSN